MIASSATAFEIRPLAPRDAALLAAFLRAQPPHYARFFYAFGADENELAAILSAAERDVYSGVFWQGNLVGIFMLRGWDAGYEIPSFGILVDDKYRGGAFLRLILDAAKLICRLAGAKKMMAKIHPDNGGLKAGIRLGFRQVGVEETTGNIIYHMDI